MQKKLAHIVKHNRFKELDALRGIAAIIVVLFHFTMDKPLSQFGFKLGITGVDLFFIISGFVIYMSLTKVKNSLQFIINRVSRLYPTYWACVTITFVLICIKAHFNPIVGYQVPGIKDYLGNMTMFQYYLGIGDIDGPYWTMIIEMLFYIMIVILFQFKLLKYLNVFGITICLAVVGMTTFFDQQIFVGKLISAIPLLSFIPLFFAGTLFYNIYEYKDKLVQRYAILLLCLICQVSLFHYGGRSSHYITQTEYAIMVTIYFSLFTLFVNGKLKFIVNNITLFLGKISFSLYLIHQFIATRVIIPALTNKLHLNIWFVSFCIALPVVLFLAYLINRYIEIPVSKRMREKLNLMAFD